MNGAGLSVPGPGAVGAPPSLQLPLLSRHPWGLLSGARVAGRAAQSGSAGLGAVGEGEGGECECKWEVGISGERGAGE